MLKKGDIILISALAIFALAYFIVSLSASRALEATVYYNGNEYVVVSLDEPQTLAVGETVIKVEDGAIFFEASDCPDKLCVKSGKLDKKGQTAACVPAGVVIVLSGADVPDGVTG